MKAILLTGLIAILPLTAVSDTVTIECTYTEYAQPDGLHMTEKDFVLKFLIDQESKKSYILGNNGSSDVIRIGSKEQVTFVEVTGVNTVMTTTMEFTTGKSVHSRNSVSFGDLIPSQYYGECKNML